MPHPIRESCCKQLWFNLSISVRLVHAIDCQQNKGFFLFSSSASQSPNPGWGLTLTERWNQARDVARRIEWGHAAREGQQSGLLRDFVGARGDQSSCGRSQVRAVLASSSGSTHFRSFAGADAFGGFPALKSCLMASSSCWSHGATLPSAAVGAVPVPNSWPTFFATEWFARKRGSLSLAASWPTVGRND